MESLQKDIGKNYRTICATNETEREKVQSKHNIIFYSTAGGLATVAAIGSVLVAGPLGLGLFAWAAGNTLFATAAGGAAGGGIGGAGIGAGVNYLLPRRWFGTSSVLKDTVKNLKESRKNHFGMQQNTPLEGESTASSSSDIETTPLNSDVVSNSVEQAPTNNTSASANPASPTQNNAPHASHNIETSTTTTYEFDTPADRVMVAEFCNTYSETNHFYIFTALKNYILGFLYR